LEYQGFDSAASSAPLTALCASDGVTEGAPSEGVAHIDSNNASNRGAMDITLARLRSGVDTGKRGIGGFNARTVVSFSKCNTLKYVVLPKHIAFTDLTD
jgi:hypothetical protein